jgi:hypothetical protein
MALKATFDEKFLRRAVKNAQTERFPNKGYVLNWVGLSHVGS